MNATAGLSHGRVGHRRAAGLRNDGNIAFFDRLKKKYGDLPRALALLSSHPLTDDRIAALRQQASAGDDALDDSDWQALQSICSETVAYD